MPDAFQGGTAGEKGDSMTLEKYIQFFKTHEKILIVAFIALVAWHIYGSGLNAWVDHEKRQDDIALETAKNSASKYAEVQQQLSDLTKQVAASMAQRAVDTQKQKEADDKLAGEQLAARLRALLTVNAGDVTWSPVQGDLVFTENAGRAVADVVDDKNKLQADVKDLQSVIVKQTDAIVSANIALGDEKKAHQADVNLLNAEMKTKWRSGFKWGFGAGIGTAVAIAAVFHIKL